MHSLLELLQRSENFLKNKGVSTPRLDAELLFADVLHCKRLDLYLMHDKILNHHDIERLRDVVVRRGKREPLQHIIGHVSFYNVDLIVTPDVLIPRNETEELIEIVLKKIDNSRGKRILDVGTGSGAIGIAIAHALPEAYVVAIDVHENALKIAKKNAERNSIKNIEFLQSNWFVNVSGKFDVIVSNPPYLTQEEVDIAEPEVKYFDPISALVADNNGLGDIFQIIEQAKMHMTDCGFLAIETGISQHKRIKSFSRPFFSEFQSLKDLYGRDRFVILQ